MIAVSPVISPREAGEQVRCFGAGELIASAG